MGILSSLFGGKKATKNLTDSNFQYMLASKIASLFDGFIVQHGYLSFLEDSTAVVLLRDNNVLITKGAQSQLARMQPLAYTQLNLLASYKIVRETMKNDPSSELLTMFMDKLARETLRHLLEQTK